MKEKGSLVLYFKLFIVLYAGQANDNGGGGFPRPLTFHAH